MNQKSIRIQTRKGEILIFSCPRCESNEIVKNGKQQNGTHPQRYICKDCNKSFNELVDTIHYRRRIGSEKIQQIVYLYFTGYPISNMPPLIGCSENTIRDIIRLCVNHFEKYEDCKLDLSDYEPQIIEIDEIYLNLQGSKEFYAWVAYDPKNKYIISIAPGKRDDETLRKVFKQLYPYRKTIKTVLIDGYKGYENFIKKIPTLWLKKTTNRRHK